MPESMHVFQALGTVVGVAARNGNAIVGLRQNATQLRELLNELNETVNPEAEPARPSCKDHYDAGARVDGTYLLAAAAGGGDGTLAVFCDMANGGWTLVTMVCYVRGVRENRVLIPICFGPGARKKNITLGGGGGLQGICVDQAEQPNITVLCCCVP